MATEPVIITRHTRVRSYDDARIINIEHAMLMCERHFSRADGNYVEVNGRLCWTIYQAEKQIRNHFD